MPHAAGRSHREVLKHDACLLERTNALSSKAIHMQDGLVFEVLCTSHPASNESLLLCSPHVVDYKPSKWTAGMSSPRKNSRVREPRKRGSRRHCKTCLIVYSTNPRLIVARGAVTEQAKSSSRDAQNGVEAILFDMDGVLCNSEELSRR